MSQKYCLETGEISTATTNDIMRKHCQRPGKMDENGKPIYMTEQAHKSKCDIGRIIKKYNKTQVIDHVANFEEKYGDFSGAEFKVMKDRVADAISSFEALPSRVRNRFENDVSQFLTFMENPENREEAEELGIINPDWTEETDGIGEHVMKDEHETEEEKELREASE